MAKSNIGRPPVVAILGHVDHGKTPLLDYIRDAHVQAGEVGGITQGIGAYQAEYQGKAITFIDTPGHAAFSEMRSRGAAVADLAILIVAADDGVKPQTKESVKHLTDAKIPFLVAINKMDRPHVTADKAKAELTELQVFVEGYGGNTPVVEISAKEGKGVDSLLEQIILIAELEELKDLRDAVLTAPIIEAQKDMKRGVKVSVVVKEGTLKVGDEISTSSASGKVRALISPSGLSLKQVTPGQPAQILGFNSLPHVGEVVTTGPHIVSDAQGLSSTGDLAESQVGTPEAGGESLLDSPAEPTDRLNLILKSDSLGSLEAIKSSLTPEINLISSGTGSITDADIHLATSTGAIILGFAIKVSSHTKNIAETDGVIVKTYQVIYELLEYLEKRVLRILEPTIDEEELGQAKVLKIFQINESIVAGCTVESGKLTVGDTVHLKKKGSKELKNARIKSIRTGKEKIHEIKAGNECGIILSPKLDITEKAVIIAYKKSESVD